MDLTNDQNKDKLAVFAGSDNDSYQYLTYFMALNFIQKQKEGTKTLLVVDDLVAHKLNELHLFNLAKQAMGYQSLINTLYEMTGVFKSYELTTLVMFDKQNQTNN